MTKHKGDNDHPSLTFAISNVRYTMNFQELLQQSDRDEELLAATVKKIHGQTENGKRNRIHQHEPHSNTTASPACGHKKYKSG